MDGPQLPDRFGGRPDAARRVMAALTLSLVLAGGGSATFAAEHLMVIQEVCPGTPGNPTAQYVMLRMTARSQTVVNTTYIEVEDAAGTVLGRFGTFDHNVTQTGTLGCVYPNCPAILIGTAAAQTLFGFAFDQVVDAQAGRVALPLGGGRVCFKIATGAPDCVAWGSYIGPNTVAATGNTCSTSFGTPASALLPGFALTRKQFVCVPKNNATDFENRFPHPVSNAPASANADSDGDGLINVLDCADASSGSLYFPIEVSSLDVVVPPATLSWPSQTSTSGTATRYDIARGGLAELPSGFTQVVCAAPMINGLVAFDSTNPAPGAGFYYLARARNECGVAKYGLDGLDSSVNDPCL